MNFKSIGLAIIFLLFLVITILAYIKKIENQERASLVTTVVHLINKEAGFIDTYQLTRKLEDLEKLGIVACSKLERKLPNKLVVLDLRQKGNCTTSLKNNLQIIEIDNQLGQRWFYSFSPNNLEKFLHIRLFVGTVLILITLGFIFLAHVRESSLKMIHENRELLTRQIYHDIRSPIVVLKSVLNTSSNGNADAFNLAGISLRRIEGMIEEFSENKSEKKNFYNLHSLTKEAVQEKSLENTNITFQVSTDGQKNKFVEIDKYGFIRVLSNIFNNSIEANAKTIEIAIYHDENYINLDINDDGLGISREILEKIGTKRFSSKGKFRGYGLSGASNFLSKSNANFTIKSDGSKGTNIQIQFPVKALPPQILSTVFCSKRPTAYITSDISESFELLIKSCGFNTDKNTGDILFFDTHAHSLRDTHKNNVLIKDFITEDDITNAKIGGYKLTAPDLLQHCSLLYVSRIILIEDDKYLSASWVKQAEKKSINILAITEFDVSVLDEIYPQEGDFVFIDIKMGSKNGIEIARIFHQKFWDNIWIQTGYTPDSVVVPNFVSGVIGKDFPII